MYHDDYHEIYDLVMRNRSKDYAAEAAHVAALIRARAPEAASLLDVCCGTGLHLRHFAEHFPEPAGLDGSAAMLSLARARVPHAPTWVSDIREMKVDARFDAVVCLFAISHLETPEELADVIGRFADHLAPGGVIVVEPWLAPEEFTPGYVSADLVEDGGRTVTRLSHSVLDGGRADRMRMRVHYAVADPAAGLRSGEETTRMSLFRPEHYADAFARAGCAAEHVTGGPFAGGLWIARRTG
ncbi:class I SAM-dependent methyltransferase [Nocardiopsis trehalosi]|uniref:class I SAM-dependent methyltransferase n=1 Tax=Nocardiopsis trehalosi TaxID=109329 RepID=UPI000ABD1E02|nr:class I SAM-dependent methyltransferase [Nocardiopsis trehalosi]